MKMKKILIYGLSNMYGGVEAFILNYVNHLPENKYTVELIVMNRTPQYLGEKLKREVKIHYVPERIKNPLGYNCRVNEIVKKGNYDILWCNFCTLSDITWLKAAKKYGIPVRIAHSHNSENMGNKLVLISHLQHKKIISKYVTHFFACSDVAGEFMFGDNIVKQNNYCLINNAIETDKYSYNENIRMKTRLDLKISDKIVITNVGRFHFQKNHSFLVNVFSEFYKKYPTSVLLLIGDGELMEEVKNQVKKLGLTDCVMFLGNRGDVDQLMQAADLLLMPSRFEGFPVSAIEAQASGLPCLFSDTITTQVKITESVKFESLEAPLEKWVEDMEELLKEHRKDTRAQIISAGYDIEENAEHIFERFL